MATVSPAAAHVRHLVVPGQVIAISSDDDPEGGFLRGHGTYVETVAPGGGGGADDDDDGAAVGDGDGGVGGPGPGPTRRLVASVLGTVERVNKLVSVVPSSSGHYRGQVGDLVIGRISSVGPTRWKVGLTPAARSSAPARREAVLPLSGVDLPGGAQRIRTAEDARSMRALFREGDAVSAEVQQVRDDGTAMLHTRSLRYGKLENGVATCVPPGLVRRMRQHMCTLEPPIGVDIWIGCNGGIWIQRALPDAARDGAASAVGEEDGVAPQAETLRKLRADHAATPVLPDERENIARVKNSVECLRLVHCYITPANITKVYESSKDLGMRVADMMRPENIVKVTACTRS